MQIKQFLKNLALKALGYNPVYGAGLLYNWGRSFNALDGNGITGYNNKIVYTALNILNKKLVEPPQIVSTLKASAKLERLYSPNISNEERKLLKVQSQTELTNHPLIKLLKKPNSYQTGIELWKQFWYNYAFGDGYIIALNDNPDAPGADSRKFKPSRFFAPNRNRVFPQKGADPYSPISHYLVTMHNGKQLTLYPDQVFHMSKWNPVFEDLYGYSFMFPAGKTVSKNEENQTAQGAAFVNGGRGTLFSSDRVQNTQGQEFEKMTAGEMSVLKETMQRDYAGSVNNRKMNFTNGYVTAQNYGDTLAEMELIEADKADWRDIFAVLGIPVSLGPTAEALTDNNQQAGYKGLVTNTIVPDLQLRDEKFTEFVRPWFGDDIIVISDITTFKELAPDLKLLKEVYGDAPYITYNEKRVLFNFDTDDVTPGMNDYFLPSGLMTIGQVTEPMEEPDSDAKQYDYN